MQIDLSTCGSHLFTVVRQEESFFTSSDLYCCDAIVIITVYSITVMEDDPWDNITKLEGW